jgi:hypothetical protein
LVPIEALYKTGKKEQIKIMLMGSISPIPNHNIKKGSQSKAGMG